MIGVPKVTYLLNTLPWGYKIPQYPTLKVIVWFGISRSFFKKSSGSNIVCGAYMRVVADDPQ
jgi:hypothetical protein